MKGGMEKGEKFKTTKIKLSCFDNTGFLLFWKPKEEK